MSAARTRHLSGQRIVLADDSADLTAGGPGRIVICGAPATLRHARTLLRYAPSLVVLHDAGVGMDGAGIAGLERLEAFHVPAVAVSHDSARVGDADDVLDRGSVRHLNATAIARGFSAGALAPQVERYAKLSLDGEDRRAAAPSTAPE